jgi:hypothetical protein
LSRIYSNPERVIARRARLGRDEFAAKEGISGERLSWWRWKLKRLGIASELVNEPETATE